MKALALASLVGLATMTAAAAGEHSATESEIRKLIVGHVLKCGGADCHFGADGSYYFNGGTPGRYTVSPGAICIAFMNGTDRCDRVVVNDGAYTIIGAYGQRLSFVRPDLQGQDSNASLNPSLTPLNLQQPLNQLPLVEPLTSAPLTQPALAEPGLAGATGGLETGARFGTATGAMATPPPQYGVFPYAPAGSPQMNQGFGAKPIGSGALTTSSTGTQAPSYGASGASLTPSPSGLSGLPGPTGSVYGPLPEASSFGSPTPGAALGAAPATEPGYGVRPAPAEGVVGSKAATPQNLTQKKKRGPAGAGERLWGGDSGPSTGQETEPPSAGEAGGEERQ